ERRTMPYVKSISVHRTPKQTITYILDKEKTDGLLYVSGLNVGTTVQSAYEEMKTVFENYSNHKFDEYEKINTKTSVKLFHFIHSFRPTDDVTPELATQIAKEWAEKAFGKERQILIATHVDKGHVHSHVLLNPYDLNGVKYNSNKKTLEAVRQLSNSVALQYGIKPIPDKKQNKSVTYKEWSERQKGTSWKQEIRDTIDRLVYDVQSVQELYQRLTEKGYIVKQGKHITVSIPTAENEKKKSVRIDNPKSFGEGYDKENLKQRIRLALEQKQAEQDQKKAVQEDNKSLLERLYEKRIFGNRQPHPNFDPRSRMW
ncbi:MAG: relaxase/mobilization nuclease domain-containing protein, partial [Clostridia bacterium]|nr:relaxase/mobilization nuclease domain-containing protein [Clostridia bacterium]